MAVYEARPGPAEHRASLVFFAGSAREPVTVSKEIAHTRLAG
jgi:hypothetical protein